MNLSSAWSDRSRPNPDCFTPPNGVIGLSASTVFTDTVPARRRSEILWARLRLLVQSDKNSFNIYKQKDGSYRWVAIYSNNFRDRDNPPEIITEKSHLNFVKAVNDGVLPFPELWLWHVDGSKWGIADFVGYDER